MMTFVTGQRVWWDHLPNQRMYGTVEALEDRPGVRPDGDTDLLYLDTDQLNPLGDGVHPGIPDDAYHADRGSLSTSGAKLLLPPSVPAKYREHVDNPPPPKPAFDFGKLAHKLVLGDGADILAIDADDYRTNAARSLRDEAHRQGKIPALKAEHEKAVAMAEQVWQHPAAGPLLTGGTAETSLYATDPDTGIRLRARPDYMTCVDGRLVLVDLKTSVTSEPEAFARRAADYKYHLQASFYRRVAMLLELDDNPAFLFVAVEKDPPFLVSVVEFDAEAIAEGNRLTDKAIHIYADCVAREEWPGYPDDVQSIGLPPWAYQSSGPTIGDLLKVD